MTAFPFDIVGFDLDGTLLDTSGDLAAAVDHALGTVGRAPLGSAAVRSMIGGGARHMLAQALTASGGCDPATLDRLLPVLLTFYEANLTVHTRPFSRVTTALDALASRGVAVAVATNKLEALTVTLLERLDLLYRFAVVVGGDTAGVGRGKPAPDPLLEMIARCGGGRAVFVGDSLYDVEAAHAAGLPVVACSFGYRQQPVEPLGADAVIDDFAGLLPALERVGKR